MSTIDAEGAKGGLAPRALGIEAREVRNSLHNYLETAGEKVRFDVLFYFYPANAALMKKLDSDLMKRPPVEIEKLIRRFGEERERMTAELYNFMAHMGIMAFNATAVRTLERNLNAMISAGNKFGMDVSDMEELKQKFQETKRKLEDKPTSVELAKELLETDKPGKGI